MRHQAIERLLPAAFQRAATPGSPLRALLEVMEELHARTLEIATGVTGFGIDEPAGRPFHVVVRVPPAAADQMALVRRVVDTEKPAATTAEVVLFQEEASRP